MAEEIKTETEVKDEGAPLEGKMAEFVEWVGTISVMELSRLVTALEKKLGVSAAAPAFAVAAGAGGGQAAAKKEEEQTEFTVMLTDIGPQKIQVIKEIRAITALGLKESKDLVEGAPKPVKEGVTKEEAQKIKEKLEAAGAKAEIK